jgi:hypothetical protein
MGAQAISDTVTLAPASLQEVDRISEVLAFTAKLREKSALKHL